MCTVENRLVYLKLGRAARPYVTSPHTKNELNFTMFLLRFCSSVHEKDSVIKDTGIMPHNSSVFICPSASTEWNRARSSRWLCHTRSRTICDDVACVLTWSAGVGIAWDTPAANYCWMTFVTVGCCIWFRGCSSWSYNLHYVLLFFLGLFQLWLLRSNWFEWMVESKVLRYETK